MRGGAVVGAQVSECSVSRAQATKSALFRVDVTEGAVMKALITKSAIVKAHATREGVVASECAMDVLRTGVLLNGVSGIIFKRSKAGIFAENSSCFDGKRLGTGNAKRAVLSRAARRAPRHNERRSLAVN